MTDNAPLSRTALIEAMSKGIKPKDQWRIGAEHEKFGFDKTTLARPAYDGPNGIKAMLEGLRGGIVADLRQRGLSVTPATGAMVTAALDGIVLQGLTLQDPKFVQSALRELRSLLAQLPGSAATS